jgi:hypothetical protein
MLFSIIELLQHQIKFGYTTPLLEIVHSLVIFDIYGMVLFVFPLLLELVVIFLLMLFIIITLVIILFLDEQLLMLLLPDILLLLLLILVNINVILDLLGMVVVV